MAQNLEFAEVETSKAMSNIQLHFIYPVAFFKVLFGFVVLSETAHLSTCYSLQHGMSLGDEHHLAWCQEPEIAPLEIPWLIQSTNLVYK